MRAWFGKMHSGESAIVVPDPMLYRHDEPVQTSIRWWRIRRIFGFAGGHYILALIVVDRPVGKVMLPETECSR